MLRGTKFNQQF